jgi:hypothetical protein
MAQLGTWRLHFAAPFKAACWLCHSQDLRGNDFRRALAYEIVLRLLAYVRSFVGAYVGMGGDAGAAALAVVTQPVIFADDLVAFDVAETQRNAAVVANVASGRHGAVRKAIDNDALIQNPRSKRFMRHFMRVGYGVPEGSECLPVGLGEGALPCYPHFANACRPRGIPEVWWISGATLLLIVLRLVPLKWAGQAAPKAAMSVSSSLTSMVPPKPQETIRALMGKARKPYVDHSGDTWTSANYCQGGTSVDVPPQRIEGTEDAPIYLSGVRGIAHCIFPVTGPLYEVHFGFAETTDLRAATRVASLSINAGPKMDVDVVDNAGGDGMETSTVVTNVAPENDGAIHLGWRRLQSSNLF